MWQNLFPSEDWTAFLKDYGSPLDLQAAEITPFIRELIQECGKLLQNGKIGKAIDRISLGFVLSKADFLSRLKREGLLRHSHFIKIRNPVAGIAKHLLTNHQFFKLTADEILYFESLQNIEAYATEMRGVFQSIVQTLLKYKVRKTVLLRGVRTTPSIVKSLLALNDHSFLTRTFEPDTLEVRFTLEDRSEAISFLLSMSDELIHIRPSDLLTIDKEFISSKKAERIIVDACRFKAFKEFEILIEGIGYICRKANDIFQIECKDERTFKSIELSHIIGRLQQDADSIRINRSFAHLPSIKELAAEINKKLPDIVQLKKELYERFTMHLPDIFIVMISKEDIGYFNEEYNALEYIQNEMSLSLDDLEKYEIVEGITLYEFLKINRVFAVLQEIYSEEVRKKETPENYLVVLNSILAIFKRDEIINMFDGIIPAGKMTKYLEIMSWKTGEGKYLDLQYTPIVQSEQYYLLSLSVMRHSRSIRNINASSAKKGMATKNIQIKLLNQVPQQLADVFKEKGFTCHTDLKVYFEGQTQKEGDIDFLAYKDGHLFIAECKDVLDSVDAFEYRRINDYLLKAASQLDFIKSAITDPIYQKALSTRLNIDLSKLTNIHYLIIPTARKMYGHNVKGYSVRNMHELLAFVKEGNWDYKLPESNLHIFHLWEKSEFRVDDLITFCSNEGPHNELIKALIDSDHTIGKNIVERRYALDIEAAFENLKKRYRFTEQQTLLETSDIQNELKD